MENLMLKEIDSMMQEFKEIPFDKALPVFQDKLWNISLKYGKSGDIALKEYFEWKSKVNNK